MPPQQWHLNSRVLSKDRLEFDAWVSPVLRIVMIAMVQPEAGVHHVQRLRNHLGPPPEAGEKVVDLAVVALDGRS